MGRIVPLEGKVEIDAETLLGALRPSKKRTLTIDGDGNITAMDPDS